MWKYNTNITDYNKKQNVNANLAFSQYSNEVKQNASKYNISGLGYNVRRQFNMITSSATSKDGNTRKQSAQLVTEMEATYSKGCVKATSANVKTVKINGTKCLTLGDLSTILRKSRDYNELLFVWKGWRDATGPKIRSNYKSFVDVKNKGAKENNWKDYGAWWRSWYEVDSFQEMVEKLWVDLKPFYQELHAYVRFKLSKQYKEVKDKEPIPANVLGNMWSQTWENVYDLVVPYKSEYLFLILWRKTAEHFTAILS